MNPYIDRPHPLSGMTNGMLGMWLFLSSEVMFFGGLFSAYIALRQGATDWPRGSHVLSLPLGVANTIVLLVSGVAMLFAKQSLRRKNFNAFRWWMGAVIALAALFLGIKAMEYRTELARGNLPSSSLFLAQYFTLTGLHALHVFGGILVCLYLWIPGSRLWKTSPDQFAGRVSCTTLYWQFVDVIWLIVFAALYVL